MPYLDDWAMLIPPFSVVLVKVEAMDCSVECSTDASKLAEAPALRAAKTRLQHHTILAADAKQGYLF